MAISTIEIFSTTMVSMKSLFLTPFICHWIENYTDVFFHTNVGLIVLFSTTLLYFHLMPLTYALFLLFLCVLQLPCDIQVQPNFREFIPPSVLSLVDAVFRGADPTGRISSLSRCNWNDEDFLVIRYSAVVLVVACFARFFGLFPCLCLFLVSLQICFCMRDSAGHESSLGSVPTEEPEKVECEEMSSNPINGSIPSVKIEEFELVEKALMTNIAPLGVESSLDSIPLEGVEKDRFKENASDSNSEVYNGPVLSKKFDLESFLPPLPMVEEDEISTSASSSDEWFHIDRDGMDSDGDIGEVDRFLEVDPYGFEQLIKHLHPRFF